MTPFAARWRPRGADPRHQGVACGRPGLIGGGCPGKLGWAIWFAGVGWRLNHTQGYYFKDGPNRYRLGFRDRDANGRPHRYSGRSGRRPHPLGLGPDEALLGQSPVVPTIIVCPVCHRDNDVQEPPHER